MNMLNVSATGLGLNYLPQYYAEATGRFEAHGIKVCNAPKDPWTGVLDDLESGAADVVLGGLWVPAMLAGMKRDVVAVGQLNARFPMVLVTREPVAEFGWSWLGGKTVLVPGVGGTAPYEFTAGLIREAGLNPADTKFVRDLSTDLLRELFEGGLGDAMVADLTTATMMWHEGLGYLSCQLADVGGAMPNSVYYVRRDRLEELRESLVRFLRAVRLAMNDLLAMPAAELASVPELVSLVTGTWPAIDAEVLLDVTSRLITNGTWAGVEIEPGACDRWTTMLFTAGLLTAPVPYASLVDAAVAAQAG